MSSFTTDPNDVRTLWDRAATTRWGSYLTDVEWRAIDRAQQLAGPPGPALEVGTEGGRWSRKLTELGWSMTCTDVNPQTLAVCQDRVPSAKCILVQPGDTRLPVEDQSVQLVLCVEVPPVIHSDWFPSEAYRVLRPGGCLVGVQWNQRSPRGIFAHITAKFRRSEDYYHFAYTAWRDRQLLPAGFRMVHEEGFSWFPFRRFSNSGLIPYCIGLEENIGLRKLIGLSPWIAFVCRSTRS